MIPGLGDLIKNGLQGLLGGTKDIISQFHLSPEDKLKMDIELKKLESNHSLEVDKLILESEKLVLEEKKALLADTQDARTNNAKIQDSDKASWMAKNVSYFIAIFVVLLWGTLTLYLIGTALKIIKTTQVDLTGIYGLYASVTAVCMTIINFFFGSSVGSHSKSKQIENITNK